jgi:hypothetical protein
VGHGVGQLGGKDKTLRHPLEHTRHGIGSGHLVPGVVELQGVELAGIIAHHILCGRAGRVKAGCDSLVKRAAAGAKVDPARGWIGCGVCLHGSI